VQNQLPVDGTAGSIGTSLANVNLTQAPNGTGVVDLNSKNSQQPS
jgi:hypothetical protein